MRAIDENGENLGVLATSEALKMARERGLDLIEIGPMAKPPVARIMSFDKYRYQEEKKAKKQRAQQKNQEMKRVQISARAAEHDLGIKAKKVNQFLKEGNPIEIQLRLRGREKAHKDLAKEKLLDFLKIIDPEYKILLEPKYSGRGFNMQITKK